MEPNKLDAAINQLQNSIMVLDHRVTLLASAVAELRAQQEEAQGQYTLHLDTKGNITGFDVKGAE